MDFAVTRKRLPSLGAILAVDAALELVAGVMLVLLAPTISEWLALSTIIGVALGVVFLGAAIAVWLVSWRFRANYRVVRGLAFANAVGGGAGWLLLLAGWGVFPPPGRALLGASSDVFIALGVFELMSLRRAQ